MITADINSVVAERKLGQLARDLGFSMRDMVIEQSRLAAQGCIQSTPPLNKGMKISQKSGRAAIARDVSRLFGSVEYYTRIGATTWTDTQTRDVCIKMPDGGFFRVPFSQYGANTNQLASFHQRHRSKKTGRAFKVPTDKQMIVQDDRLLKRYRGEVWKRMGQYAAGWLPALEHFAGLSKISKGMKVPLFVKKAVSRSGLFQDDTRRVLGPEAIITNRLRFGYPAKLEQLIAHVARERESDAVKWMRLRLKKLIAQRGLA